MLRMLCHIMDPNYSIMKGLLCHQAWQNIWHFCSVVKSQSYYGKMQNCKMEIAGMLITLQNNCMVIWFPCGLKCQALFVTEILNLSLRVTKMQGCRIS